MNRGSNLAGPKRDAEILASMRPRFMNRGSVIARGGYGGPTACFNEAPIHESGKCWRR